MIYTYVYPVEGFDRNIADDSLIKAYLEGNSIKRFTFDEFIEELNNENINPVNYWVRAIDDAKDYYPISSLHLDDLEHSGFDVSKVTEDKMIRLANKLSNDYSEQLFWSSLEIIAEAIGIPRKNKTN